MNSAARFHTRRSIAADLRTLGVAAGQMVMVHAAIRRIGPLINGPDTLIEALLDVLGPNGTLIAYTDWHAPYEELVSATGTVPPEWREDVPPFDQLRSRAVRHNGVIAEFIRTTPGARRSGNPGASVAAIGAQADWITADHPLDYGYGPGSPLAKLVERRGAVLLVGAPWDTVTLLHYAEHLGRLPGKHIRRIEVPFATAAGTEWRMIEEFDTGDPVIDDFDATYFEAIVREFRRTGGGQEGQIGDAPSLLLPAAELVSFAVDWMERRVEAGGN